MERGRQGRKKASGSRDDKDGSLPHNNLDSEMQWLTEHANTSEGLEHGFVYSLPHERPDAEQGQQCPPGQEPFKFRWPLPPGTPSGKDVLERLRMIQSSHCTFVQPGTSLPVKKGTSFAKGTRLGKTSSGGSFNHDSGSTVVTPMGPPSGPGLVQNGGFSQRQQPAGSSVSGMASQGMMTGQMGAATRHDAGGGVDGGGGKTFTSFGGGDGGCPRPSNGGGTSSAPGSGTGFSVPFQSSFIGRAPGGVGGGVRVVADASQSSGDYRGAGPGSNDLRTGGPCEAGGTQSDGMHRHSGSMSWGVQGGIGGGSRETNASGNDVDLMDDDDDALLESLDIDQIVAAHREKQSSQVTPIRGADFRTLGSPEPNKEQECSTRGQPQECSTPVQRVPDLEWICSHGTQVYLCVSLPEHLKELKDQLLVVLQKMVDNANDLSPMRSEELRKERATLTKRIAAIEERLKMATPDDERRQSHYTAGAGLGMASPFVRNGPWSSNGPIRGEESGGVGRVAGGVGTGGNVPGGSSWQSQGFSKKLADASTSPVPPPPVPPSPPAIPPFPPPTPPSSGYGWDGGGFAGPAGRPDYGGGETYRGPEVQRGEDGRRKFIDVTYHEGNVSKEWSRDFSWSTEIQIMNWKHFGNRSFRPNQREVINATMSGRDCFVLMPTGGGKSLTYQVPAACNSGVTLVVSPLVSLIRDQIMHLEEANIPAAYLSANLTWEETLAVLNGISEPDPRYRLLYVTPEKIARSNSLFSTLEQLYRRDMLSRIVIDEAHCVSQWGHDFRPDYQGLRVLKEKFPKTPVLALTATASMTVKEDVVQVLGLRNCVLFRQSFNRPNLRYEVRQKTKKCFEEIDKFIRANYQNECGIIYCLSRNDCEKSAEILRNMGHKAAFYHANMDPAERDRVQQQWSRDEVYIICATIAFGMGINKPDVRFVIHHSLPKSIEGYHQESGRAGRDGQSATCILYYSYGDYIRLKHMLTAEQERSYGNKSFSEGSTAQVATNLENLLRMVSYCENDVDCRRTMQLAYFGETFDASSCKKTCDNCSKNVTYTEEDITNVAKDIVTLVLQTKERHTLQHLLDIFRGSQNAQIKKFKHDCLELHGVGKKYQKTEAERILRRLVCENVLREEVSKSDAYGSVFSVLKVNSAKAADLENGKLKVFIKLPVKKGELSTPTLKKPINSPAASSRQSLGGSPLPTDTPVNTMAAPPTPVNQALSAKVYNALAQLRTEIVNTSEGKPGKGLMPYHIFQNAEMRSISLKLPKTMEELAEINGFGKVKCNKYGERILQVVRRISSEESESRESEFVSPGKRPRTSLPDDGQRPISTPRPMSTPRTVSTPRSRNTSVPVSNGAKAGPHILSSGVNGAASFDVGSEADDFEFDFDDSYANSSASVGKRMRTDSSSGVEPARRSGSNLSGSDNRGAKAFPPPPPVPAFSAPGNRQSEGVTASAAGGEKRFSNGVFSAGSNTLRANGGGWASRQSSAAGAQGQSQATVTSPTSESWNGFAFTKKGTG
ncbi:hypothetical protein CBR_g34731 [Chara braunii]|uniref:DNA 3'-5' helicase n=1 Tax=Chara braunii TaxID=69332 RepID=A0A388JYY5_CHABU|nr:hypothetical protein CBR_g34731 [Chara braunii]|eukprot:GBG63031.1 hypothetical protein CBR_g34731 [Chara braunii]